MHRGPLRYLAPHHSRDQISSTFLGFRPLIGPCLGRFDDLRPFGDFCLHEHAKFVRRHTTRVQPKERQSVPDIGRLQNPVELGPLFLFHTLSWVGTSSLYCCFSICDRPCNISNKRQSEVVLRCVMIMSTAIQNILGVNILLKVAYP